MWFAPGNAGGKELGTLPDCLGIFSLPGDRALWECWKRTLFTDIQDKMFTSPAFSPRFITPLLVAFVVMGTCNVARSATASWTEALQKDPRLTADLRWLDTPQGKTMMLYRPGAVRKHRGAVILLHGLQAHADWPQVIRPLREELPRHGWTTLSVQLPAFDPSAAPETYFKDVATRISAALIMIGQRKAGPVALLGSGTGATAGMWYLAKNPKAPVSAIIAISMQPLPGQSRQDSRSLVEAVTPPVLDIYAQRDLPPVLAGIDDRAVLAAHARSAATGAADQPTPRYRQLEVDSADADYSDQADVLIKRIRGWMRLHLHR